MKKFICVPFATILLLSSLVTSCKKELPLDEAIIGKWEVTSYKYIIYMNNVRKSEVTIYLESGEMAIQFAEEGVGIMYEDNQMAGNFTWTLSGSTLTLNFSNGSFTWDITIDEDILVWSYTESEVEGDIKYDYEFFYNAGRTG